MLRLHLGVALSILPPPRPPAPEQTLCTTSQDVLDTLSDSISGSPSPTPGPLTQIRTMLKDFPSSPTEESLPVPLPPVIAPINTTLTPPGDRNGTNKESDSLTTASNSPETAAAPVKNKRRTGTKGRFPWRYERV